MPPFRARLAVPDGLVLPVRADPAGVTGPTRAVARGKGWRKVSTNAWVPARDDDPPEQRILDIAPLVPAGGAVTGWAALRLHEAAYFDGRASGRERPVPVALGSSNGRRRRPGVVWSHETLPADEVMTRHGLRVTSPVRALFDELRSTEDERDRVVAVHMALAAHVVRLDELVAHVAARSGWRRAGRARGAVELGRYGSRSPQESRLWLVWLRDAGFPEAGLNQMVFDRRENFVLCADLLDEEAGLVIEYDGDEHRLSRRRARDARRTDAAHDLGLELVTVVAEDLRDVPRLVERLRAARARSRFLEPEARAWTTTWPPGWAPWW